MTDRRLPDFIIGGAMKSGTTSIHQILAAHPDVYIPEEEVFFFDMDDPFEHAGFQRDSAGRWNPIEFGAAGDAHLDWYADFFADAGDDQIVGEDSTTYLTSARAPRRICERLPDVKLIFMLRDPVARAYSNYWHLVKTGRASDPFDVMLRTSPRRLLARGFYRHSLERYDQFFSRDQIAVFAFERFVADPQAVIDEMCEFLGLESSIDVTEVPTHANETWIPRLLLLGLAANWFYRQVAPPVYREHLPVECGSSQPGMIRRAASWVAQLFRSTAGLFARKGYPPMREDTRHFLQTLYGRRFDGLDDMVDADLSTHWSWMAN